MSHTTYVSISTATIIVPADTAGDYSPGFHLVGIGLFVAHQRKQHWRFAQWGHAVASGTSPVRLLDWAAQRLPSRNAVVIGWDVDHGVWPPLLWAAQDSPPATACSFMERLGNLLKGGVIDLSLNHGGVGAPPVSEVAADMAIYAPSMEADAVLAAWEGGNTSAIGRDLGDKAQALWRMFLRQAGLAGLDAETATEAWNRRRRQLRVIHSSVKENASSKQPK